MNIDDEIARCRAEQALCEEGHEADQAWLVTLGWCDWQWEQELLESARDGNADEGHER